MYKRIKFSLKNYPSTPNALRAIQTIDSPCNDFIVQLARLYHHYYTDFWGVKPINPDHTNFEYLRYLDSCNDFRFLSARVSNSTAQKRVISFSMGQAFCRYFLYEFSGITYFAHMDKVLNKELHPAFDGMKVKRIAEGSVPDYLCAKSVSKPFIAEAKGRFSNIDFNSVEFNEWRQQFTRIRVFDRNSIPKKIKGFIIGTKFSTDTQSVKNKFKVYSEDPNTDGEEYINSDNLGIGKGCIALHYARLLSKLGLQLLASSLDEGFVVPSELSFNLPIWRCKYPPLEGETFIGGYFSDIEPNFQKLNNGNIVFYPNIFKLGSPSPSFLGLKASIFRQLREVCLGNWNLLSDMQELEDTDYTPSNLAWLRDGSITGPLDFFDLVGSETF